MSKLDSVFDECNERELEFDILFDEEDSLIDTVNGVNEAGDPLTGIDFDDLHQTQDDATKKDIEDELGPGHDNRYGASNPEGSKGYNYENNAIKGKDGRRSEADSFYHNSDEEYQRGLRNTKPDASDLTSTINKAIGEGTDVDDILDPQSVADGADIDDILDDDDDMTFESATTDIDDVLDGDDPDIDAVLDDDASTPDLGYDMSDEEIIDMAINGD